MEYHLRLKGFVGDWDFDADYTQYILDKYKGQPVNVIIDSLGGRVYTALSISAAFKVHGDVHVHYVAANASAATIASLGAKHVSIDSGGWYLVHKCSSFFFDFAQLNADELDKRIEDLQKQKDQLDRIDKLVAAAYARRCKKSPEEMLKLMEGSPWLSAQEALEWGFVDEITDFDDDPAPVIDSVTAAYCAQNGIALPDALKAAVEESAEESLLSRIVASVKSAFHSNKNISMDKNQPNDPDNKQQQGNNESAGLQPENKTPQEPENNESAKPEEPTDKADQQHTIDALQEQVKELKRQNSELQAKLDKAPADSHKQIVEEKQQRKSFSTNLSKSARDLLDSIS